MANQVNPDILFYNFLDKNNNIVKKKSIPSEKQGYVPPIPLSTYQINNDNIQYNGNLKFDPENAENDLVLTCVEGIAKWKIAASGSGDVSGNAPSVIGNIPKFDNILSTEISDSGIAVTAIGDVSGNAPSVMEISQNLTIFFQMKLVTPVTVCLR